MMLVGNNKNRLHFYSYDFIENPWLAGGGSLRDIEILSRMGKQFEEIHLFVGGFPNTKTTKIKSIHIHYLGFGRNELISRLSYFVFANLHLLFQSFKASKIGVDLSPYSPLFCVTFFKNKSYGILHHMIGKRKWKKKIKWFGLFFAKIEQIYISSFKNMITINDFVFRFISKTYKQKIMLQSENGFNTSYLKIENKTLPQSFLLFVGRIEIYMKGLDILLNCFKEVQKKHDNLQLIIAGRGTLNNFEKLKKIIKDENLKDQVLVKKNISEKMKMKLLGECLFFVSPSRYEGWGIAAVEANAAGKVAVVSNAHGFKNSIKDGFSGFRVNINSKDDLIQKIEFLLQNSEQRRIMNNQSREWARQFSWDEIVKKEMKWISSW